MAYQKTSKSNTGRGTSSTPKKKKWLTVEINTPVKTTGKKAPSSKTVVTKSTSKAPSQSAVSSRGQAFKAARAQGKTTFSYGGKTYHTRQAGESVDAWKAKMAGKSGTASKTTTKTVTKTPVNKTVSKTVSKTSRPDPGLYKKKLNEMNTKFTNDLKKAKTQAQRKQILANEKRVYDRIVSLWKKKKSGK